MLQRDTFDFLKELAENNHREWFQANKNKYLSAHENVVALAEELLMLMQQHDEINQVSGKKSLHRIYRDIRFSKDKTPYKNNFSGGFSRRGDHLRGGYYFHLAPGNVFLAGGFWGPNAEDLKLIRSHIQQEPERLREIMNSEGFIHTFKELKGEKLKTAPKGFPKDDPAIDLLRYKQFLISRHFTDEEVFSNDFAKKASDTFQAMRPFFDNMSEVLTTDLNGISLF